MLHERALGAHRKYNRRRADERAPPPACPPAQERAPAGGVAGQRRQQPPGCLPPREQQRPQQQSRKTHRKIIHLRHKERGGGRGGRGVGSRGGCSLAAALPPTAADSRLPNPPSHRQSHGLGPGAGRPPRQRATPYGHAYRPRSWACHRVSVSGPPLQRGSSACASLTFPQLAIHWPPPPRQTRACCWPTNERYALRHIKRARTPQAPALRAHRQAPCGACRTPPWQRRHGRAHGARHGST